jgi:hypothetical protein
MVTIAVALNPGVRKCFFIALRYKYQLLKPSATSPKVNTFLPPLIYKKTAREDGL